MFKMDISLIEKVFEIVIDNAIKYSPNDSKIEIILNIENNKLVTKIIDYGIGFSQKSIDNIFKFFVSSDDLMSHSEGTGLSLAAAKSIMEMHNFEIKALNSTKGGAEIHLIF